MMSCPFVDFGQANEESPSMPGADEQPRAMFSRIADRALRGGAEAICFLLIPIRLFAVVVLPLRD